MRRWRAPEALNASRLPGTYPRSPTTKRGESVSAEKRHSTRFYHAETDERNAPRNKHLYAFDDSDTTEEQQCDSGFTKRLHQCSPCC